MSSQFGNVLIESQMLIIHEVELYIEKDFPVELVLVFPSLPRLPFQFLFRYQIPDSGFSIHCKYSSKENVQKVFQKDCKASKGRACFQRHIPEIKTDTGDKHKRST